MILCCGQIPYPSDDHSGHYGEIFVKGRLAGSVKQSCFNYRWLIIVDFYYNITPLFFGYICASFMRF